LVFVSLPQALELRTPIELQREVGAQMVLAYRPTRWSMSSRCSRNSPRQAWLKGVWESGWHSCGNWLSFTAGRLRPARRDTTAGANLSCGCLPSSRTLLVLAKQPIICALTGWGQQTDRESSQAAGIDRHLVKPIDRDTLQSVLAQMSA
jgi:hypothetical protein